MKRMYWLLGVVGLALVASACAPQPTVAPTATSAPLATQPPATMGPTQAPATAAPTASTRAKAPIGTLTVATADFGLEVLTPWLATSPDLIHSAALFDPLVGSDESGRVSKSTGLATDWKVEGDSVVFTLRQGVKFHDGSEFTAVDAKFSIEKSIEGGKNISSGGLKSAVKNIVVEDKYALRLILTSPNAILFDLLAWVEGDVRIAPKAYVERVGEGGYTNAPMGTGPFKFVSHQRDVSMTFEANPDYWDKTRPPQFKTLKLLKVLEVSTRVNLLKTGGADLILATADQVPKLQAEGYKLYLIKTVAVPGVFFYQCWDKRFITNNVKFRRAAIEAIDLKSVIQAFYPPGTGDLPNGGPLFSPISRGYDPNLPTYPYDPDNARKLLKEIGYAGERLDVMSFPIHAVPEAPKILEALQQMWKAVGINAVLNPVDVNVWRQKWQAGPSPDKPQGFEAPGNALIAAPQGRPSGLNNFRVFFISHKAGGASSAGCDLDKADAIYKRLITVMDEKQLDEELRKVNREIYNEYWAMPLVYPNDTWLARADRIAAWGPVSGVPFYPRWETAVPGSAVK